MLAMKMNIIQTLRLILFFISCLRHLRWKLQNYLMSARIHVATCKTHSMVELQSGIRRNAEYYSEKYVAAVW